MVPIAIISILGFALSAVILAANLYALSPRNNRGLCIPCAIAAVIYGLGGILQSGLSPLLETGNDYTKFWLITGGSGFAAAAGFFALLGLWRWKRRPGRYNRGKKRALWIFWLSTLHLFAITAVYFLATHPDTLQKVDRYLK